MHKPKGGRGKRVPYSSVTVRVPEELKAQVEELVEAYRLFILEGIKADQEDSLLPIDQAKALAQELLKGRSTRKDLAAKLITSIYGEEIKPEDLA
jgi:Arc/MetJ-type ribon-helix-helix transcriptional regulator